MDETESLLDRKVKKSGNKDSVFLFLSCFISLLVYMFVSSKVFRIALIFINIMLALLMTEYNISMIVGWGALFMAATQNVICASDRECAGVDEAFKVLLQGFSSELPWLVFASFQIGHAVEVSKLGQRVSLLILRLVGSNAFNIGYGIYIAELILAPFVPSNTARGGGLILPIVQQIIIEIDDVNNDSLNGFIVACASISNLASSSFFMTGTIGNPLISAIAKDSFGIEFGFFTWLIGNLVPGGILLLVIPLFLFSMFKPEMHQLDFQHRLTLKLAQLGTISQKEIQLSFVLIFCLLFWIVGSSLHISATFVAMFSLNVLVAIGVIEWQHIIENSKAWDSLFWLALMIKISQQISDAGLAKKFGEECARIIISMNLSGSWAALLLSVIYFLTMYFFSSITAHTLVFITPFFNAAKILGCSPYLITGLLAYFSPLSACLTNYSSGSQAMYFSLNYITRKKWFKIGFMTFLIIIIIYLVFGGVWWKILGWY